MSENSKLIQGRTGPWEIVMGLEIHAQVASKAKLFSGAATANGAEPNRQACAIDLGLPGADNRDQAMVLSFVLMALALAVFLLLDAAEKKTARV